MRTPAPKLVSLSDRQVISFSDAGLFSVSGASIIITAVSSRKIVTSLSVAHNQLGGDGFNELFSYLCSPDGRKHGIAELDLHNCGMDDEALAALCPYLEGNEALKSLQLQQNEFGADTEGIASFTRAINSSKLRTLVLSSMNPATAEAFVTRLLEDLDQPYLHELTLSYNHLPPATAAHIAAFITSPRCHVRTLRLSANNFSNCGVRSLIAALEHNYSLTILELFANAVDPTDSDANDDMSMQETQKHKMAYLMRNDMRCRMVEKEALLLLRSSRTLLLGRDPTAQEDPSSHSHSIRALPIEIQLYILSFIAPSLSSAQRVRIFQYSASRSTLPRLLPRLSLPGCIRDPSSLPGSHSSCDNGACMGRSNSLSCRREKERSDWLTRVGCDMYMPERAS